MSAEAKQLLQATSLAEVLPNHSLVSGEASGRSSRCCRRDGRCIVVAARCAPGRATAALGPCRGARCSGLQIGRPPPGAASLLPPWLLTPPLPHCPPLLPAAPAVTTGCRMEAAIKTLHDHRILSCPVMAKGEVRRPAGSGAAQPAPWRTQYPLLLRSRCCTSAPRSLPLARAHLSLAACLRPPAAPSLACPPPPPPQYHGCISVNDVLKNLMAGLGAKKPHVSPWAGGGGFGAARRVGGAAGRRLASAWA